MSTTSSAVRRCNTSGSNTSGFGLPPRGSAEPFPHAWRRLRMVAMAANTTVASSTANWDFLPRLSVARSLARAGYVVISYDRLGFARSPYRGAGKSVTSPNQQAMLHEVVGAVRGGTYALGRGMSCAKTQAARPERPGSQLQQLPRRYLIGRLWRLVGEEGVGHASFYRTRVRSTMSCGNRLERLPDGEALAATRRFP